MSFILHPGGALAPTMLKAELFEDRGAVPASQGPCPLAYGRPWEGKGLGNPTSGALKSLLMGIK